MPLHLLHCYILNAFTFAQLTHAPLALLSHSPPDEEEEEEEEDGDVEEEDEEDDEEEKE